MPQSPLERVQTLLFETRINPLAILLDLASLLPQSLVQQALALARNVNEDVLRALLVREIAKCLPAKTEQVKLTKEYPVPRGTAIKSVSVPEGKEAKRLIARLTDEQRHEVFEKLLEKAEPVKIVVRQITTEEILLENRIWRTDGTTSAAPSIIRIGKFPASDVPRGFETFEPNNGNEERNNPVNIVNLGFSHPDAADQTLESDEPLLTGKSYYFWLNIGREHKNAIGSPTPIDLKKLPQEAVLTVAVFGFENELIITSGNDVGELKIQKNNTVKVLTKPTTDIQLSPDAPANYLDDFLLFPISVPDKEGTHRLRCNICCSQVLVQSYVVSANVKTTAARIPEACSKKLDYVLSQSLRADHLASLTTEPNRLSLLLNNNGDGTHSFRFFGADGNDVYKDDAQIDGQELGDFLSQARGAMHKVSWGNSNPWDADQNLYYRYERAEFDLKKLALDLAYLARAGWRIYAGFVAHLKKTAAALEQLLATPGQLQIALKLSPRTVLPAAVVYDYAWKPERFAADFDTTEWELCPTFCAAIEQARAGGPPLEECECFKGGCALKRMIADVRKPGSKKTLNSLPPMICPSGFWGYRHALGLPLTLDGTNTDIPPVIDFKNDLEFVACVSTDQDFVERDPHLRRLQALKPNLKFNRDEDYDSIVVRLKSTTPHFLYFYCHGGIRKNNHPYLKIGDDDQLAPDNLVGEGISWQGPHPLVFINGCHTTSLNPEISLDFVSSFVQQNGAAGVVGTEITIFEPLATSFAEECLSRFIGAAPHKENMPLGKAVRGARLALLQQGNPLGLVYIPYAVASLRLHQETQN